MSDTMTDAARDLGARPSPDRSDWSVLKLLRQYLSWDGPSYGTGELAAFSPAEARVMGALGWARPADAPDPALVPEPEPVIVRALHGFTDPDSGACFGTGERVRLPGRVAAALMTAGTVVLDDGVETLTPQAAKLARARERRLKARGGR